LILMTSESEDVSQWLIGKKKWIWSFAIGGTTTGILLGLGLTRAHRHAKKDNVALALKAFMYGTALCGISAFVVVRTTMWAMDVHNIPEFGQKVQKIVRRISPYQPKPSFTDPKEEKESMEWQEYWFGSPTTVKNKTEISTKDSQKTKE